MTGINESEFGRLERSIEFYRHALQNFVEFTKTDKRSKPQLLKRLATLEKEAGLTRPINTALPATKDALEVVLNIPPYKEDSPLRGKASKANLTRAQIDWILGKKRVRGNP